MDIHSLQSGDIIYITNTNGEKHKADFIEYTADGVYVNFKGFGHLEVKWTDIVLVEQIVKELKRDTSYGPRYKITLWKNDQYQS
jgi:anaerobic selenocysteine-containing dehydrogenase